MRLRECDRCEEQIPEGFAPGKWFEISDGADWQVDACSERCARILVGNRRMTPVEGGRQQ